MLTGLLGQCGDVCRPLAMDPENHYICDMADSYGVGLCDNPETSQREDRSRFVFIHTLSWNLPYFCVHA